MRMRYILLLMGVLGLAAGGCDQSSGSNKTSAAKPPTAPPQAQQRDAVADFNRFADEFVKRFPDALKKELPEFHSLELDTRDVKKTDSVMHPLRGEIRLGIKCDDAPSSIVVFYFSDDGTRWRYERAGLTVDSQSAGVRGLVRLGQLDDFNLRRVALIASGEQQ